MTMNKISVNLLDKICKNESYSDYMASVFQEYCYYCNKKALYTF